MNDKGFTLIELIVYITVFVVITVVLAGFVANFIGVQAKIKIDKEVSENGQRAMEIIAWQIRHAQGVYQPTSSFNSHPGQLSLETGQDKPDEEEMTYLDFYLDDNQQLCLKKEESEAIPLTSRKVKTDRLVFSFLIDSDNNQAVRIEMESSYRDSGQKMSYQASSTLVSTVNLRND